MWLAALAMAWTVALPLTDGSSAPPVPIIGGEAVDGLEWSNVVLLESIDPVDRRFAHLCTGTLIAPRFILTAAHCLAEGTAAEDISVYFGVSKQANQRASVKRFGLHPDACVDDCDPEAHDFAFIEINEDVSGVPFIPLLISQEEWDETMAVGEPVTVVGFGAVRDDEAEGEPPLTPGERGYKRVVTTRIDEFTKTGRELIAGEPGKDTCGGDSGGPAFVQLADGSWRQAGVTSRGVRPCGAGRSYYGVPFYALTWLRDDAGLDLLPDGCEAGDCLDTTMKEEGCGCRGDVGAAGMWMWVLMLGWRRAGPRARR